MSDHVALMAEYGIDKDNVPKHVAIIMDGNGRWAKQRNKLRNAGHKEGQKTLKRTLINCVKIGVKVLTVYAFSTENWSRPKTEVSFLMKYLKKSIQDELDELDKEGVRIRFLGDISVFSSDFLSMFKGAEDRTKGNTTIQLNIMLNYGGRREIVQAAQQYVAQGGDIEALTEEALDACMYTAGLPDPDILIRTSGEYRISNFMLWQLAYSELFFIEVFWPDFNMEALLTVVKQFQSRDRRYGGLKA